MLKPLLPLLLPPSTPPLLLLKPRLPRRRKLPSKLRPNMKYRGPARPPSSFPPPAARSGLVLQLRAGSFVDPVTVEHHPVVAGVAPDVPGDTRLQAVRDGLV